MSREESVAKSSHRWEASLQEAFSTMPRSAIYEGADTIAKFLTPFMGSNFNHTHLPTGGGYDFENVQTNSHGHIELGLSGDHFSIVNPKRLHVEVFNASIINSFLLLDLNKIEPIGLDEGVEEYGSEELVELPTGRFVKRHVWDDRILGYNERDEEILLPVHARLVTRWFKGKLLFLAKGSLWNGSPAFYRGQHSSLSAKEIRNTIEAALDRGD